VPVKGLADSKRRLTSYLGDKKKLLVEALLQDVLSSIIRTQTFDTVLVISPDENVEALARMQGVEFLEQTSFGLNRAIEQANRLAQKENVRSMMSVLADIPLAEPRDFAEIFQMQSANRRVVLTPSLKGGTNVKLDVPPGVVKPSYGRWSFYRHLRQAQLAELETVSVSNPRTSLDIDTIDDLVELRRRDPQARTNSAKVVRQIDPLITQARVL